MKYVRFACLAALAGPAVAAAPAPLTATLAAPLAAPVRVDNAAARWSCTGTDCVGPASNARLGDARACRELAKAAGAVATFQGSRGPLSADDLAKCNKAARPAN